MKTARAGTTARHLHLVRTAQVAGESFAWSPTEERRPNRLAPSTVVWLGLAVLAALTLAVAL